VVARDNVEVLLKEKERPVKESNNPCLGSARDAKEKS